MTTTEPPEGYSLHTRRSEVTKPWEPIFASQGKDRLKLGLWLRHAHCNSRGFAHGGVISTLADNAMGLSCAKVITSAGEEVAGLVTLNLSVDYMGVAKTGQWLEIDTDFVKAGRTVCFARAQVLADGEVVSAASATFRRITR